MSHLNILLAEVLLAQTFMAIYVYLLTYFKKPAEVSKTIWIASAAAILVLNMLIVFLCGYHEAYRKIWAISLTLPYLIVTTLVSYHKLLQVLFNLLTVMYIACFSVLTGDIAFLLTGRAAYQLISHILCLAAGLILILRLRRPFLKASELLRKGWGALCCVPLTIVLICLLRIRCFRILLVLFRDIILLLRALFLGYALRSLIDITFLYRRTVFHRKGRHSCTQGHAKCHRQSYGFLHYFLHIITSPSEFIPFTCTVYRLYLHQYNTILLLRPPPMRNRCSSLRKKAAAPYRP